MVDRLKAFFGSAPGIVLDHHLERPPHPHIRRCALGFSTSRMEKFEHAVADEAVCLGATPQCG